MKGGKTPIHLMRWAPADYVNDPAVKLALAKRDFVASTFYPLFLFHAFIQGGDLPADPVELGAIVGMRPADVTKAVNYWHGQGKLQQRDGRIFHERVVRDVADEIAFRAEQAERGRLGGRPKKASGSESEKPLVVESKSPPAPAPLPAPAPAPAPSPDARSGSPANPLVAGRRVEMERECLALVAGMASLTGEDPVDVLAGASHYAGAHRTKINPASMTDDRLANTVRDLRRDLAELNRRRDSGAPIRPA